MEFQLRDIPSAVATLDGLPRVDWAIVERWLVDHHVRTDHRDAARLEAVLQWLELLADALGDDYWINSAARCILLTSQAQPAGDELLRFAERALDQIARLLDVRPIAIGAPKHILLRLDRIEVYYTYISHFFADGAYGGSGGMCIRAGIPHIVLTRSPYGTDELVIAHELTHAVLNDYQAPAWVEEGVAQIVQQQVTRRPLLQLNHELAREMRAYWKSHSLEDFWSGKSFRSADDGQAWSYQLAEILVRLILSDHRRSFLGFLEESKRDDAGEAAAQVHFGRSLSEIAATFLGR